MLNPLFEHMENAGLLKGGEVVSDRVETMPLSRLLELAEESTHLTSAADTPRADTVFVHSATLSLGGGRHPCGALECRLTRISELARFAALYSDRVYIRNFFMDYFIHPTRHTHVNEPLLRANFHDDLLLLVALQPLIESGRLVPITPPGNRCPHCLWTRDLDSAEHERLRCEFDRLRRAFFESMTVEVEQRGGLYGLLVDAPRELLEHRIAMARSSLPRELARMPRLVAQVRNGKTVGLGRSTRRKLGLHDTFASEVFRNVIFELVLAESFGTSFLTERPLHLKLLNSLAVEADVQARNHLAQRHLTALVPFVEDVSIADLLTLRAREEEAFVLFRQKLNQVIDEVRQRKGDLSSVDARQIYSDVLAPALSAMDRRVAHAKRDLVKTAFRRSASWVGAISFGVYAGFIPSSLAALAGTLGLAKVVQEFSETLMNKSDVEQDIRSEPLYFLWRVRRRAAAQRR